MLLGPDSPRDAIRQGPRSLENLETGLGDERVINRSLLSRLCSKRALIWSVVLVFCTAVLGVSFYVYAARGFAPVCSSNMSPPHATNRSVGTKYCIDHSRENDLERIAARLFENTTLDEDILTFAVIGDFGRDGYCCQRDVAVELDRVAKRTKARFVINTGDSFYENGILTPNDEEVRTSWADVYNQEYLSTLNWWGVLGNHDYRGNSLAVIALAQSSQPRFIVEDNWWSRVVQRGKGQKPVRFIMIDTSPMIGSYASSDPYMHNHEGGIDKQVPRVNEQLQWLEAQLQIPNELKIVVGHHPAFSHVFYGSEDRNILEKRLTELLNKYGALAYFGGHDHNLQFARPATSTTAYFVSGAGSRLRYELNFAKKSDLQFYHVVHGFLACSIVGDDELRVVAVDMYGKIMNHVTVTPTRTSLM